MTWDQALGALGGALITAIASIGIAWRTGRSQDEVALRRDLMSMRTDLMDRLDKCEARHREAERREGDLRGVIVRLEAQIERMHQAIGSRPALIDGTAVTEIQGD